MHKSMNTFLLQGTYWEKNVTHIRKRCSNIVTLVTYTQYPWCNNVTCALRWDPHSHWCRGCITCRHSMKDRHSSSPPLPICLGYCTTDAHVFRLPIFFCSACHVEKTITIWENDSWERYAPFTHGANHIAGFIYPLELAVLDVYT